MITRAYSLSRRGHYWKRYATSQISIVCNKFNEINGQAGGVMVGCDFTLRTLQALVTRRRQLVEMRKQEATRLKQTHGNVARTDIRSLVAILDRRIQKIEAQIATLITTNPDLADTARRVQTVPGVGLIVAATLLIEMPELGTLDAKQAASLAGLALHANPADGTDAPASRVDEETTPGPLRARSRRCPIQSRPCRHIPPAGRSVQTRQGRHYRNNAKTHHPRKHTPAGKPKLDTKTRLINTDTLTKPAALLKSISPSGSTTPLSLPWPGCSRA